MVKSPLILSRSMFLRSSAPNSLTLIGSSRPALTAMRRKFATDTPGIVAGYWKARNRPARARSSGSASVRSSPFEQDAALGHLVGGVAHERVGERGLARAVRAHQGVRLALLHGQVDAVEDLAVLGADVQVLDLQGHAIAFSAFLSGWTRSSSVISFRVRTMDPCTRVQRSLVGQGSRALAGAGEHPVRVGGDALDRGDVALQRRHDLGHRDLLGRTGERVAPVRAAARLDQLRLAQALHQVLEIGERQPLGVGDRAEADRLAAVVAREVGHHADAVLGFGREHHRRQILPDRVGEARATRLASSLRSCASASGVAWSPREADPLEAALVDQREAGLVLLEIDCGRMKKPFQSGRSSRAAAEHEVDPAEARAAWRGTRGRARACRAAGRPRSPARARPRPGRRARRARSAPGPGRCPRRSCRGT